MENLSTQDSLKIIQAVIDLRKQKYEQNGIFLIIWGALVAIAGITQYIMIQNGQASISGYAWLFTMVPGAIITFIAGFMQGRKKAKKNERSDLLGFVWALAGVLAFCTGFFFGGKFGIGFTAVIYLPFCIAAMASALALRNYLWIFLTILGTIIAYSSVFIPFMYHPLISASVAFLLFLLPGIQLYINHKKRNNV